MIPELGKGKEAEPTFRRRSFHFVPYTLFEKKIPADILNKPCDVLVIDLEDSVRPEDKTRAREDLVRNLTRIKKGLPRELSVRVNPLWTDQGKADVEAFGQKTTVMVPKIYSLDELEAVRDVHEFIPIFETVFSLEDARTILSVHGRKIKSVIFGKEDLLAEIGEINPEEGSTNPMPPADLRKNLTLRDYFTSLIVVAGSFSSRPMQIVDGISREINVQNRDDFEDEVIFARRLGAGGKISIHPPQIDAINRAFKRDLPPIKPFQQFRLGVHVGQVPNYQAKLENARRITRAFRENTNSQNVATVEIDGEEVIIGPPTYKLCQRLLERAALS